MLYVWDCLLNEPLNLNGLVAFHDRHEAYNAIDDYLRNYSDDASEWSYFDVYVGVVDGDTKGDFDKTYDDLVLEYYLR